MLQKIKHTIKFIINYAICSFIVPSKKISPNSILLIRLDAIGDYVLFRNFIKILKESPKYKNYEFTLLGNPAWKSLVNEFDKIYIDNFIWLDRNLFITDYKYRYKQLKMITSKGYKVVLSPVYSRNFLVEDLIVKSIYAQQKIGYDCDLRNMKIWQKKISDKYYTRLIEGSDDILFEFDRNKEFFQKLLDDDIKIEKPSFQLTSKKNNFNLAKKYAILFIGANEKFRQWDIENFVQIGSFLKSYYHYEIVLCGGQTDEILAQKFKKYSDYDYTNLVGKTSLIELLYIIKKAKLMVSNETSAPHFAVALNTPYIFVISNGNNFGRFSPYPKKIYKTYFTIFPQIIEEHLHNLDKMKKIYGGGSNLSISQIPTSTVIKTIKKALGTVENEL